MSDENPKNVLVRSKEWQKLRQKLLNNWMQRPEWCCNQLRYYLGDVGVAPMAKLNVVMNYLTGTGFRTGRIKHPCINSIRTQISMERKKRKAKEGQI